MNKKGIFDTIEIMVYFVFIIIVSLFIYMVAFSFLNEDIKTMNLEAFLLKKSLISSENCLAYNDGIRLHQGVIDLNKLNSETRLLNCFSKKSLGYQLTLYDSNDELIKKVSNLDSRQESYLPVCNSFNQFNCAKKQDIVLYTDGQTTKTGKIVLEVIRGA